MDKFTLLTNLSGSKGPSVRFHYGPIPKDIFVTERRASASPQTCWSALESHYDSKHHLQYETFTSRHHVSGGLLLLNFAEQLPRSDAQALTSTSRGLIHESREWNVDPVDCLNAETARALVENLHPSWLVIHADQHLANQAEEFIEQLRTAGHWWSGYTIASSHPDVLGQLQAQVPEKPSMLLEWMTPEDHEELQSVVIAQRHNLVVISDGILPNNVTTAALDILDNCTLFNGSVRCAEGAFTLAVQGVAKYNNSNKTVEFTIIVPSNNGNALMIGEEWRIDGPFLALNSDDLYLLASEFNFIISGEYFDQEELLEIMMDVEQLTYCQIARPMHVLTSLRHPSSTFREASEDHQAAAPYERLTFRPAAIRNVTPIQPSEHLSLSTLGRGERGTLSIKFLQDVSGTRLRALLSPLGALSGDNRRWLLSGDISTDRLSALLGMHFQVPVDIRVRGIP